MKENELTVHKALDEFKSKIEDKDISVALLFCVDKNGRHMNTNFIGKSYKTLVALDFMKQQFIDEVIADIVESHKKKNAEKDVSVN